ncbi:MAG: hypothetical protein NXI23_10365 [Bacteroidetes bacterium]|jgi:hypothetical protein|nr:hypothetical protein [Bacteroidota bacterium]
MNKYLFFLLSIGLFLFSFGCKNFNDLEDANIISGNSEYAIPLLVANTSLQELLEEFDDQTTIEIGPEGLITLRYFGDVVNRTSSEIIGDALGSLPEAVPLADTLVVLPFESPAELEVDFATFSKGVVSFTFAHTTEKIKEMTLEFPEAFKNGETLKLYQFWDTPQNLVLPGQSVTIDLRGYDLIPKNGELHVRYDARNEDGDRVLFDIAAGDLIFANMPDLGFSYIEGYLGNHVHPGERDTIKIDFFENWLAGEVYFEDPKVWIRVENSFGIPTESLIEDFTVHYAAGGSDELESSFLTIGEGIEFEYPELDEIGDVATTVFPFNKDNSNIEVILGSSPIAMEYKVDALTNPNNLVDVRGFLTDSSYYKIQVDVELPVFGRASGFAAADTFDVDFDSYSEVEWAEFKIVAENDIPLDVEMQFYFADEQNNIIDSLLTEPQKLVQAAPVNNEGDVTGRTKIETFVPIEADRFGKIQDAKKIYLNATFSTIDNGQTSVKVLNTQEVEIRMGLKLGTN